MKVENVEFWVYEYIGRRYGKWNFTGGVHTAWHLLYTGAYQYHWSGSIKSIVDRGPGFVMTSDLRFNASGIAQAWELLLTAATHELDPSIGPLRYDLVDIGRQALVNAFVDLHTMYLLAYEKFAQHHVNSSDELGAISSAMIGLLSDLDALLSSDTNFLLGHWIADARNSVPSTIPKNISDNLEFNARNQITMWGPHQNVEDYASKEWAGLVKDYYLARWSLFTSMVNAAVRAGQQFNQSAYENARFDLEQKFSYEIKSYPTVPQGDTIQISAELVPKYNQSPLQIKEHYVMVADIDIVGSDLFGTGKSPWNKLMGQLAWLCDVNPTCVGFNNHGFLKNSTCDLQYSPGALLFLKK